MCISCDLLQGLDLDALSPQPGAVLNPLHLPVSRPGLALSDWLAPQPGVLAGRLRRCPPAVDNGHRQLPTPPERWAEAAAEDFRHYWLARLEGRVRADLRYCVTLPSAYTLLCAAGQGEDLQRLALCEQEVAAGVKALLSVLPAEHLALQWDVPAELRVWQTRGRDLNAPRGLPERLLQSMVTQWAEVPEQAELGLHLCHVAGTGASGLSIPDIGQAVRLVGAIIASTERQPQFVHLPVPPERDGTAYFESLLNLALWPSMEVHLGLVHEQDSPEDVATRLSAAREVLPYAAASLACQTRPATGLRLLGVDHA